MFTKEHLPHLNSARLRASVFDKLAHFISTLTLQRVQFTQCINPDGFRPVRALQVSLFFITTQPRNLTNCRNTTFPCLPFRQFWEIWGPTHFSFRQCKRIYQRQSCQVVTGSRLHQIREPNLQSKE